MKESANNGPVLVAGSAGMVGSAICRALEAARIDYLGVTRDQVDLTRQADVEAFLADGNYSWVVIAAAKVGGIHANDSYPAEFLFENLMIETNLINGAFLQGIRQLLFLGSSCIYPGNTEQPIREEALLTGPLEPTNEPYALAKIAGLKLCESYNRQYGTDYRSLMPSNLYGPGDNFHLENAHVIPALMRRFHEARVSGEPEVVVWGTGKPRREFLYVDDLAEAAVQVMSLAHDTYWSNVGPRCAHVNVGCGRDVTIAELAETIRGIVGLEASLAFDATLPDGTPQKLLNVSRLEALGWKAQTRLADGLRATYHWFLNNEAVRR